MEILAAGGYVLAENVLVKTGESWFSPQINLPKGFAGASFEVSVVPQEASNTGNFVPRGGNRRRHARGSEVVTTPTEAPGIDYLPVLSGIETADLPDLSEAPKEWTINLGNANVNFIELQFKCLTGSYRISVIAASSVG